MTSRAVLVQTLLDRFAAASIDLVEWERPLQRRLGVPFAADGVQRPLLSNT